MSSFFVVKIVAEDGKLSSGHTEAKRTAEYFVRAETEAVAIGQVTQWVIFKAKELGPRLLRYLDISASLLEEAPERQQFIEMGLENFDPDQWLHFIKQESPKAMKLIDWGWDGNNFHMTLEDGTEFCLKDAYMTRCHYHFENNSGVQVLEMDVKFETDIVLKASI